MIVDAYNFDKAVRENFVRGFNSHVRSAPIRNEETGEESRGYSVRLPRASPLADEVRYDPRVEERVDERITVVHDDLEEDEIEDVLYGHGVLPENFSVTPIAYPANAPHLVQLCYRFADLDTHAVKVATTVRWSSLYNPSNLIFLLHPTSLTGINARADFSMVLPHKPRLERTFLSFVTGMGGSFPGLLSQYVWDLEDIVTNFLMDNSKHGIHLGTPDLPPIS